MVTNATRQHVDSVEIYRNIKSCCTPGSKVRGVGQLASQVAPG